MLIRVRDLRSDVVQVFLQLLHPLRLHFQHGLCFSVDSVVRIQLVL